eukprot:1539870-Amphidinium_carterae.1
MQVSLFIATWKAPMSQVLQMQHEHRPGRCHPSSAGSGSAEIVTTSKLRGSVVPSKRKDDDAAEDTIDDDAEEDEMDVGVRLLKVLVFGEAMAVLHKLQMHASADR